MKLCVVGIGGAGGKVTQEFLENDDLDLKLISWITQAEYISTGGIKGIWLEADKNDAKNIQHFFGDLTEGAYPGFFIPHDVVGDGSELHVEVKKKYGYDVKKQGFVRDAQYLKAIYEIFETDKDIQQVAAKITNGDGVRGIPNPIFDCAWSRIRPYTTLGGGDCDGILFVVSFGGGTGTGFINPIINHIRNEGKADYPVFVLGILTEPGDFADRAQFANEGRRSLAAISAIYDLLTKSDGANGVILVDNQILMDRFGNDYASANKFIYEIMRPIVAARDFPGEIPPSQVIAQHFSEGVSRSPLFVPLYATQPRMTNPEEDLVRKALAEGKLFGCVPEKADWAIVFCRGFVDSEKIRQAISTQAGLERESIWVLRKMGDGDDDEILVLLRNPYGLDSEAYKKEGTLENRFCQVINLASRYMKQNVEALFYEGKDSIATKEGRKNEQIKLTEETKISLKEFFFGKQMETEDYGIIKDNFDNTGGFAFELREASKRLITGDKPPIFLHPIRIFDKDAGLEEKDKLKARTFSLDEQRILEIVDKRVEQKLADLKLK